MKRKHRNITQLIKGLKALGRHLSGRASPEQGPPQDQQYSFCETVTATGASCWHIRKLTDKGRKLCGGADTAALCGRVVAWDLAVNIDDHHLGHCCQKCAAKHKEK